MTTDGRRNERERKRRRTDERKRGERKRQRKTGEKRKRRQNGKRKSRGRRKKSGGKRKRRGGSMPPTRQIQVKRKKYFHTFAISLFLYTYIMDTKQAQFRGEV
jgi:hypothetical protein